MSQFSLHQVERNQGGDFAGGLSFGDAPDSTSSLDAAFGDLSETPLFITTALSQMRDAIELISLDDKKDYLEALRLAPVLVQTESNPVTFLRVDDFNPWKGARRLVLYWKYRRKYFPKSRWLLSLHDDSGAGALDENDVQLLRNGWLAMVTPKEPKYGRFLLINHGRYPRQGTESRIRVCFYLASAASDTPAQAEPGVMAIRLVPTAEPGGREVELTSRRFGNAQIIYKMLIEALPVRFRGVMLLSLEEYSTSKMMNLGFRQISSLLSALLNTQRPFVVSISSISEAAEKLLPYGVPPEVIPESHGGTFTYEKLFEWKRVTDETDNAANCVKIPWISPPEDKDKEVNALYARRAYHKRKLKVSEQKDEVKRLYADNERLKKENVLLEYLMRQATDILIVVQKEEPVLPDFEIDDDDDGPFDNLILPPESSFDGHFASEVCGRIG